MFSSSKIFESSNENTDYTLNMHTEQITLSILFNALRKPVTLNHYRISESKSNNVLTY